MAVADKTGIQLESGTNELNMLEFLVGDQHFGINVAKIYSVMQYDTAITPMPHSADCIEGVFKPRDVIITVVDLAKYMGLPPSQDTNRDILLITQFNKTITAFHIHSVVGINRVSWTDIEKPDLAIYGGKEGMATGIARVDNRLITIIDFEKILAEINPQSGIKLSDLDQLGSRNRSAKPILVAEDSPLLEKMLTETLHKAGYTTITMCANGQEAWDKLISYADDEEPIESRAACVVTDIEMPQMDGHRLLKQIKDHPKLKKLPVIIFSSLISEQMRRKGDALGASAQISKPEIVDLVKLIDTYIL